MGIRNSNLFEGVSEARSRTMRAIRSVGNYSTERRLRAALVKAGVRGWRLHCRSVPGTPDFYFPRQQIAVFVDGCFWHGCPDCGHIPKTRNKYWRKKIARNRLRDIVINRQLRSTGTAVIRFWECDLQNDLNRCVAQIQLRRSQCSHTPNRTDHGRASSTRREVPPLPRSARERV